MIREQYLIIPSVPTPNGSLHLGHIGGPFLTADIIARTLQRQGHYAEIFCGTDSYESYVIKQALKENKSPRDLCHFYHEKIYHDLQVMDIGVKTFVNPLNPRWNDKYIAWQNLIFKKIEDANAIQTKQEAILWDDNNHRYLVGCWLHGLCPVCSQSAESFFCEKCGAYFSPDQMQVPNNHYYPKWVSNLFMAVPYSANVLALQNLYEKAIARQNGLFRLTVNANWGIEVPNSALPESRFFSYGLVFAYFLLFGELYDVQLNAFYKTSSVKTIACFGLDNAVAFLASTLGITTHCPEYKTFDYYLPNYFYHLDNKKFSKSKRHAIFVEDIVNVGADSDVVRLFLATMDVRTEIASFTLAQFVQIYNETVTWIENDIVSTFQHRPHQPHDNDQHTKIKCLLAKQNALLHANNFMPHQAVKFIYEWLSCKKNNSEWYRGMALLVYPFMPKLGKWLWQCLGYTGEPSEIADIPVAKMEMPEAPTYRRLNQEDFYASINE